MRIAEIERVRGKRQSEIDATKTVDERRRMGQFSTPIELSTSIVLETSRYLASESERLNILEPSMGTGSFVSAALSVLGKRIAAVRGFELDRNFYDAACELWTSCRVVSPVCADFTRTEPEAVYDLIFANPPYSRHHTMPTMEKKRLQSVVKERVGLEISGLAGLYCHFLLLSQSWMRPGAIGVWLIPAEWMKVNYGDVLRTFFTRKVRILRIHCFATEDVRFSDALVSSCVVWFQNTPPDGEDIEFTYGKDLAKPEHRERYSSATLKAARKWPPQNSNGDAAWRLGDFFDIRRGVVTGDNGFFVMKEEEAKERGIPRKFLRPILPSPRNLNVDRVESDSDGLPINAERRYLLDCSGYELDDLPDAVRGYLAAGLKSTAKKNLCASRSVWYEQERRLPTPFLCSYMGRGGESSAPVRFILNETSAIVSNSFLMLYPKGVLSELIKTQPKDVVDVWSILLKIPASEIIAAGRSYGGGLRKVEPRELASVPCDGLYDWLCDRGCVPESPQHCEQMLLKV